MHGVLSACFAYAFVRRPARLAAPPYEDWRAAAMNAAPRTRPRRKHYGRQCAHHVANGLIRIAWRAN